MAAELAFRVLSAFEGYDFECNQVDLARNVRESPTTIAAGRDLRRRPHPPYRAEEQELLSASLWTCLYPFS